MTTIAYKDGVLAADSLATRDDLKTGRAVKISRLDDGRLVGRLGSATGSAKLFRWLSAGEVGEQPDVHGALVVVEMNGTIKVYEDGAWGEDSAAPFSAWGCGAPIAIGAMAAGATAQEAVRIAGEWDTLTGGEVTVLMLQVAK